MRKQSTLNKKEKKEYEKLALALTFVFVPLRAHIFSVCFQNLFIPIFDLPIVMGPVGFFVFEGI